MLYGYKNLDTPLAYLQNIYNEQYVEVLNRPLSLSIESGDTFYFRRIITYVAATECNYNYLQLLSARKSPEDKMTFYREQLAYVYYNMKKNTTRYYSPEYQKNEMLDATSQENTHWVTYKPYHGQGIFEHESIYNDK